MTHPVRLALLAAVLLAACSRSTTGAPEPESFTVPAKGTASTLDFATWNLEWFGDASNGPADEALQLGNAHAVIAGTDADVWSVQEIVDATQWNALTTRLAGYVGVLANDPSVIDGPKYYSDFGNREQKVGILWKTGVATLQEARVILGAHDYQFAGRPPLQARLRVTVNGTTEDVVVIALHMKCCADSTSWLRRRNAAAALEAYLDSAFATQKVFVIGDWNDDVDGSIWGGRPTPYANFLAAPARYTFVTKTLSEARQASTTDYPDTIDHHLVTNEAAAALVPGSVEVYRLEAYVASYATTTSDHYPVLARYRF